MKILNNKSEFHNQFYLEKCFNLLFNIKENVNIFIRDNYFINSLHKLKKNTKFINIKNIKKSLKFKNINITIIILGQFLYHLNISF